MKRRQALIALCMFAACGGTPRARNESSPVAPIAAAEITRPPDPDLQPRADPRALDIDWSTVTLASESDALALWRRIAPTGDDWQLKVGEIPPEPARPLALALLRGGNFTCMKPAPVAACSPLVLDVDPPAATAGFDDPCLRRLLALWALNQIENGDLPAAADALRSIVTIPAPESELVAAAIAILPESEQDLRLELVAKAWAAGQRDVATTGLGSLDAGHLVSAASQHHIDGAIEILSAKGYRAVFIAAVTDEKMGARARVSAISELATDDQQLQPDTRAAFIAATRAKDCFVAAAAARALEKLGDKRFVPAPPRGTSLPPMMHALCVLSYYEKLQTADEDSLLAKFVPPKGLEVVTVAYDSLGDDGANTDGDGDPHTQRTVILVPRSEVAFPEVDDMARAFGSCNGKVCSSADRDFHYTFAAAGGSLRLTRVDLVDHPPCPVSR